MNETMMSWPIIRTAGVDLKKQRKNRKFKFRSGNPPEVARLRYLEIQTVQEEHTDIDLSLGLFDQCTV